MPSLVEAARAELVRREAGSTSLVALAKAELAARDAMLPRGTDPIGASAPVEADMPRREQFSREGFDLAKRALSGEAVQVPSQVPLWSNEGRMVNISNPARRVLDFGANALAALGGVAQGAYGYGVGLVGDAAERLGMETGAADRLSSDLMAVPEAFAGSPTTLPIVGRRVRDVQRPDVDMPSPALATASRPSTTPEQVGSLIRSAAAGSKRSTSELGRAANIDQSALAAAERLGMDLPPDVFSQNTALREAAGLTRSVAGSNSSAAWREVVRDASIKADEAIASLSGGTDLSTVSASVFRSLERTGDELKRAASTLYDDVDAVIAPSSVIELSATRGALEEVVGNLLGPDGLRPAERSLYKLVKGDQPVTYTRLMRERDAIGRALSQRDGPYADIDRADLTRLYVALSEDRLEAARSFGGDDLADKLAEATRLTAQRKDLESQIVSAFGRDLEGSIANRLRAALVSGAKGDVTGLNRVLNVVPEDLRGEAVATALLTLSQSRRAAEPGFGFAEFTKIYGGIRSNAEINNRIMSALGPDARQVLDDLYSVGIRVQEARSNVLTTGKANQALLNPMVAEGVVDKVLSSSTGRKVVQGAATGAGAAVGGPLGAAAVSEGIHAITTMRPDRLAAAGDLFRSEAFKVAVEQAEATGRVTPTAMQRLARSPQVSNWARLNNISDPQAWITDILTTSAVAVPQVQGVAQSDAMATGAR